MLIDEILYEFNVRKSPLDKLRPDASDAMLESLQSQFASLNALTPRFAVDNIYAALNPQLLGVDTETAKAKDAEGLKGREFWLEVGSKAPLSPPWWTFSVEMRDPQHAQRVLALMRFDRDTNTWLGSLAFDRAGKSGAYDFVADCIRIELDPTNDMYATETVDNLEGFSVENVRFTQHLAEVVRLFIQLKNYKTKEKGVVTPLVGSQTTPPPAAPSRNQPCSCGSGNKWKHCRCPKGGHGRQGTPPSHPAKPSPETTLLLDPFIKKIMGMRGWNLNGGSHASPKLHLREGGWRTYTVQHPLGGATAWQTGKPKRITEKNVGRFWFPPTDPTKPIGDARRGVSTKRSRVKLGNSKSEQLQKAAAAAAGGEKL